ncbi:hypothetical protein FNL56_21500 [Tardiphaga sp. vice304]|uniref:phage terminase large subunit family protein n=1 Tax=Tardiphaga sp. vice304 TaxID=2592817 RepID=UPI001162160C|nr:terminase gpA endonuclease subunit [Tardiphaga sp. vice304]QDM28399.1 hypothetical protein FNL56_21500 [Tardiphaga sp. vice304]
MTAFDLPLMQALLGAFNPPELIAPSAFAEANIVLPSSANAQPGPLRLASYQHELVDSIAATDCEIIVYMLSSQVGKSLSADAQMAYVIASDPGPALHVSPTSSKAEQLVRNRIDPLIGASPTLRALVGRGVATRKGSTGGADSLTSKTFPGGQIDFGSSFKADDLAARAIKYLFLDEVDRFAKSVGVEGDPVSLAIKRTKTFENAGRKVVIISTPTSRMGSRVAAWFERGDKRRFFVACPDCDHRAPLSFEQLKWEQGKPEAAQLMCEQCGCLHDETTKRKMVDGGTWVATALGEPGVRSYHLNELASKFSTLASVAAQFDAATTPEMKQSFFNTTLAEVYDAGTEIDLSSSELQQRAVEIVAPYPADIQHVCAGVDVQGDRLECTILATGHSGPKGEQGQAYVLNHIILRGDTSADTVWLDLDDALGQRFQLLDGRSLPVQISAIDSGFSADQVNKFVLMQRKKSRRCYAIKGTAGFDKPATREGGRLKGVVRLLLIGVDGLKLSIAKRLSMQAVGPGYIHLPSHLDTDYFDGLASEQLVGTPKHGFVSYRFEKTVRANEALDSCVYASAVATLAKPDRSKPATAQQPKPTADALDVMSAVFNTGGQRG